MKSEVRLITMDEVLDRVPYSRIHIRRLFEAGKFPKPVPVGPQRIAFVASEIDAWIATRLAERDASEESPETLARRALGQKAIEIRHSRGGRARGRS